MKKTKLLIFILLSTLLLLGCGPEKTSKNVDDITEATMSRYDVREIKEYKGIRLDPAVGPRDNSIEGIQDVNIDSYTLKVTGLVDKELTLTYDEVLELPAYERVTTLYCVEGWDATMLWEGIKLVDLFEQAGVQDEAIIVIFKAADGYSTSLDLDVIKERDMLMAYKANTVTLPANLGYPFIVVAEDKYGYKWTRWVTEIVLSDFKGYRGYWESLGYSNYAEVPDKRK